VPRANGLVHGTGGTTSRSTGGATVLDGRMSAIFAAALPNDFRGRRVLSRFVRPSARLGSSAPLSAESVRRSFPVRGSDRGPRLDRCAVRAALTRQLG